jgi:hypothetical protein
VKKLRSFLAGLLLVPVLAFASPFQSDVDVAGLNPTKPVAGYCWIFIGRWILVPC